MLGLELTKRFFATKVWIKCSVLEIKITKAFKKKIQLMLHRAFLSMVDANTNEVAGAEKFRLT